MRRACRRLHDGKLRVRWLASFDLAQHLGEDLLGSMLDHRIIWKKVAFGRQ